MVACVRSRYHNLRLWTKDAEGTWRPSKRGVTVRLHELADFVEGVAAAVEEAKVHAASRS